MLHLPGACMSARLKCFLAFCRKKKLLLENSRLLRQFASHYASFIVELDLLFEKWINKKITLWSSLHWSDGTVYFEANILKATWMWFFGLIHRWNARATVHLPLPEFWHVGIMLAAFIFCRTQLINNFVWYYHVTTSSDLPNKTVYLVSPRDGKLGYTVHCKCLGTWLHYLPISYLNSSLYNLVCLPFCLFLFLGHAFKLIFRHSLVRTFADESLNSIKYTN